MKNKTLVLVLTIFLLMNISIFTSGDEDIVPGYVIYVDDDGGADYTEIQDAIDEANDRDIIYVYNGFYNRAKIYKKNITLIGENKKHTVIDGDGCNHGLDVFESRVVISGFTIQNCNFSGITFLTSNSTIKDVIVKDNIECGIHVAGKNNTICDSIIEKNYESGITFQFSRYNTIINNTIQENEKGISMVVCSDNYISGNNIVNNNDGLYSKGLILPISFASNIITKNNFENNKNYGLYIEGITNIISKNNFINNKVSFVTELYYYFALRNSWEKNYWGRSMFLPKPIIGKFSVILPTNLPWINFDWHPAQKPYIIQS